VTYTNGIPPVSDYSHWNEDAQRVWYEENKYDMEHPEVFDEWMNDPYDDRNYDYDDEIPADKCWEMQRHNMNTSGFSHLFGPNADVIAESHEVCDDCGTELSSDWVPNGYKVIKDSMIVYRELFTRLGRKHLITDQIRFPVYEKV
jgi:hypothetical protein